MKFKKVASHLIVLVVVYSFLFLMIPQTKAQFDEKFVPNTVFSNTAPITINTAAPVAAPTAATLYPSTINVTGMSGNTTRVQVSLRGLTHTNPSDLDFLLVGPGGQKFIFLSDGASNLVQDGVLTFADDAPTGLSSFSPLNPGFYRPVNFGAAADTFPSPAPAAPYDSTTFAANFNGSSPNGTWSLYTVDDALGERGAIDSGWELTITTNGAAQTFANTSYIGFDDATVRANPYASVINVTGLSGVITNLKVTLNNLSHARTQDIDVLLVSPNGAGLILMSDTGANGGNPANNVDLTFDDAATTSLTNFNPIVSGSYKPTNGFSLAKFFLYPAPPPPYFNTSNGLRSFNNFNPNGAWQLYVLDDTANNAGTISGGWSLDITTAPPVQSQTGCGFPTLTAQQFAVGNVPTNLAAGDFNNDGKPDLAVTNQVSNDVSILINNGSGGFLPQTTIAAGSNPYAVAVGSFNGDGNQDLAVINSGANTVSIFLGSGSGTFSAPVNFATGANPISLTVGDFNNDSRQDLAIANFGGFFSGSVSILLGNGSGGFSPAASIRADTQPAAVKAANLNADGNLDLVVASFGASTVSVYFGSGSGGFVRSQSISTPQPVAVEIADSDRDNDSDIITANYNANSGSIITNTGNGVFPTNASSFNVGANPAAVVAADILFNGTNLFAFALSGTNQVSVSGTLFTTGSNPNGIVKADFNGDGKTDLATANSGSNNVTLLTNACIVSVGNRLDFNGDRRTDIGVFRPSNGFWAIYPYSDTYIFGRDRDILTPADFDGDGNTDYAVFRPESGTWNIRKTSFPGFTIGTLYNLQFGVSTDVPAPADFDGDGKADIAVFRPSNGFWYIRQSTDNALRAAQFGTTGDRPVAADYDGDGKADIAVFRPSNGTWYISGSLNGFSAVAFGQNGDRAVPNDYDGDGKTDVAVFRNGDWYVLRSSTGGFIGQTFGTVGDIPVPGDYDSDGKFDYAVYRPSQSTWYILRSSDGALQTAPYGTPTDVPIPSAFVR